MPRLAYFHVLQCDCCGRADKHVEPVAFGRRGLATLTAQLCAPCIYDVETAIRSVIRRREHKAGVNA